MPPTVFPISGWFVEDLDNVDGCAFAPPPDDPVIASPYGRLSGTDQRAMDATNTLGLTVQTWDDRRSLAIRLLQSPVLMDSNATAAIWYANAAGTSARKFAEAQCAMQSAWNCSPILTTALYNAKNEASQWSDSLASLIFFLEQTPTDTTLWQRYLDLMPLWEQADAQVDTLQKQITAVHQGNFQAVLPAIQALPDTALYERNLKYLLAYYVRFVLGVPTSAGALDTLFYIGSQCPDLGGRMVVDALRWLPDEQAQPYMGEGNYACDNTQQRNNPTLTMQELPELSIVPNPATDRIEVRSGLAVSYQWSIWDSRGSKVHEEISASSNFTADVRSLPSGIYFLVLHSLEGHTRSAKFLISR